MGKYKLEKTLWKNTQLTIMHFFSDRARALGLPPGRAARKRTALMGRCVSVTNIFRKQTQTTDNRQQTTDKSDQLFSFQSSRAFSPSLAPPSSGEHSIEDANGQVENVTETER